MEATHMHHLFKRCMNHYVGIKTKDGQTWDGFIADVDGDWVILAIPTSEMEHRLYGLPAEESTYRQFGFHPGFFPRRRFFRQRLPLFAITDLFLLPFFL